MIINEKFDEIFKKFPRYLENEEDNIYNKKSILWEKYFAVRSGIDKGISKDLFENFLSDKSTQTSGTSAWVLTDDNEVVNYIDSKINHSLFEFYKMPMTGNPLVFEFKEKKVSMPFLWRFLTFQQIIKTKEILQKEKLNIIEIGAGYGCVSDLLIQSGKVNSYTIIDLPENLINSAYYLSENHADWNISLIDEPVNNLEEKCIYLITPGHINNIIYEKYDLAINTDSLGEMPKNTAQAYVSWLYQHLNNEGVFFSKNGHHRGNENFGVEKVSEYGFTKFEICKFLPNLYSTSLFDDFSHIGLFKKLSNIDESHEMKLFLNTLANLYATGLSEDLLEISNRFSLKELTDADKSFLYQCDLLFKGSEYSKSSLEYSYIMNYLEALKEAVTKKINIEKINSYLKEGKSEAAILYCIMLMRMVNLSTIEVENKFDDIKAIKHYVKEFNSFDKSSFIARKIKYDLRLEILRKKIMPYAKVQKSILMKLKDFYKKVKKDYFFIKQSRK